MNSYFITQLSFDLLNGRRKCYWMKRLVFTLYISNWREFKHPEKNYAYIGLRCGHGWLILASLNNK